MIFVITKCRKWAQEITIEVILCKYSRQTQLNLSWRDKCGACRHLPFFCSEVLRLRDAMRHARHACVQMRTADLSNRAGYSLLCPTEWQNASHRQTQKSRPHPLPGTVRFSRSENLLCQVEFLLGQPIARCRHACLPLAASWQHGATASNDIPPQSQVHIAHTRRSGEVHTRW